ncbi:hepatitis B virus X-interacting protein [Mycotypha africana]|uniref:hepatitis B virus X-interacting protein n=1 Tax=Mycotypha africana TaxID=64632 RepID=UPI002301B592|nr:hepatitis B virus X-interacting protein [Mycotypha africana]KAI8979208.1 hepatitis B virus X-interacting protein [Mycotypha africana]
MESELIATLNNIASKSGVKGVLLTDDKGFCLGARGIAKPDSAALISSIAHTAIKLNHTQEQDSTTTTKYPTINLEYDNYQIVIRNEGSFTLAIFR